MGLLTEHIALKDVVHDITVEKIIKKLKLLSQVLNKDFGILKPKIAVLSINPHVGDNGVIGTEDQKLLIEEEREKRETIADRRRQDFQLAHALDLIKGLSVTSVYE